MAAHRVRRLRWEVRTPGSVEAFAARQELRQNAEALLADLDAAFDRLVPAGAVVTASRLEVALRVGSLAELRGALASAVPAQVRSQLSLPVEAPARSHVAETPGLAALPVAIPADEVSFDVVVTYLRTGTVPWHAGGVEHRDIAVSLLEVAERRLADVADAIVASAPAAAGGAARLARLDALAPLTFRLVQLVGQSRWVELAVAVARRAGADAVFVEAVMAEVVSSGFSLPVAHRVAATVVAVAAAGPVPTGEVSYLPLPSPVDVLTDALPASAGAIVTRVIGNVARAPVDQPPASFADDPAGASRGAAPGPPPYGSPDPLPFSLPVPGCGLVLLHPFLPQFLRDRGVWEPGEAAIAPAHLPRAAALLVALAGLADPDGDDGPYEFDLAMVKALLGLRPEEFVPVSAGLLDRSDVEEIAVLLDAAISHWGSLGKTSGRALQSTFLLRSGLLDEDHNGWRLRVEASALDVLLDRLPWGLGVVRLPWMPLPLFVEWTTG